MFHRLQINYYDRYMTLLEKQENSKKEFYNIEKVKNVLRIETQRYVNAPKMIERKKIVNNQVIDFVRLDICQVIVENYFNSLIGKGNYYICDKAFKIIDEKVKSFRMRVLLKNILRLINKEGGIYAAKKKFLLKTGDRKKLLKKFSKLINDLRKLNINPVLLPDDCEFEELEGLSTKITEYFEKSKSILNEQDEFI